MNATKELRELLNQRGVSWMPSVWNPHYETYYQTDNGIGVIASEINGKIAVRLESRITPEQAVEATVGVDTCQMELMGYEPCTSIRPARCSACGFMTYAQLPSFCPHCGRRVVES